MKRLVLLTLALLLSLGAASPALAQTARPASPQYVPILRVSSSATAADAAALLASDVASMTVHRTIPRWHAYLYAIEHEKGCWYVWGGNGPCWAGYDCSGLVVDAYAHVGIHLPRTTWEMLASPMLRWVPLSKAKAGMLVFMYGGAHVEIFTNYARAGDAFGAHSQGTVSSFDDWSSLLGIYEVVGAG